MEKPSLTLYCTELFRSSWERLISKYYRTTYLPKKPGDGRPILVIPGIITSDRSTRGLRKYLTKIGYAAYPWGLGTNMGQFQIHLQQLETLIQDIHAKHKQQVILIGWSLGGIYARELAKNIPNDVSEVITLGSPFAGINEPNHAMWIFALVQKITKRPPPDSRWLANIKKPAPVKTTAIYTKQDGVVPWQACMEKIENDQYKNVQVKGSHTGLGYNKEVLIALEKILDQSSNRPVYS